MSPQLIVNDKSQNLRRLQAQRNELNAKGERGEDRKLGVGLRQGLGVPIFVQCSASSQRTVMFSLLSVAIYRAHLFRALPDPLSSLKS